MPEVASKGPQVDTSKPPSNLIIRRAGPSIEVSHFLGSARGSVGLWRKGSRGNPVVSLSGYPSTAALARVCNRERPKVAARGTLEVSDRQHSHVSPRKSHNAGRTVLNCPRRPNMDPPLPHASATVRLGPRAQMRSLDWVLWDLGNAGAHMPLLDAPKDWWHAPLRNLAGSAIATYTRDPRHLELACLPTSKPSKPADLCRRARTSSLEVRQFLQVGLMLNLLCQGDAAFGNGTL